MLSNEGAVYGPEELSLLGKVPGDAVIAAKSADTPTIGLQSQETSWPVPSLVSETRAYLDRLR
jgi:hypothetical protein